MKKCIFILTLVVILSSCATIKKGELYNSSEKIYRLESNNLNIEVIDNRSSTIVKDESIRLPIISFPGKYPIHHRRFKSSYLEKLFKESLSLGFKNHKTDIKVYILKSTQAFEELQFKEKESVIAKVSVYKVENGKKCEGVKEIKGEVESIDGSDEYINNMLESALKMSFVHALKSCKPRTYNCKDPKVVCGSVNPDDVRAVLRHQLPLFRGCKKGYLTESKKNFVLSFSVNKLGKVTNSSVSSTDKSLEKMNSCLNNILKSTEFPKPRGGGSYDVEQPLFFKGIN